MTSKDNVMVSKDKHTLIQLLSDLLQLSPFW